MGKVTSQLTMDDLGFLLFGHSAFQYLNAGCKLGLFELLNKNPDLGLQDIMSFLKLNYRPARCLLAGCTSLKLLLKNNDCYRNCNIIETLFVRDEQWDMFYKTVLFEADICYEGQADFVKSLQNDMNMGLQRISGDGRDLYHRLKENKKLKNVFYDYMSSWSRLSNSLVIDNIDFSDMKRVMDVGGGDATNAIAIAKAYPHLLITVLDLPENSEYARKAIAKNGLSDRVDVYEADMFKGEFSSGYDCFLFFHQLVIWSKEKNTSLIYRAYRALESEGKIIIHNSMLNDTEDGPVIAALDSAYFICTPTEGGMIYSWKDYEKILEEVGCNNIERFVSDSWTPHGVIIATK